MNKLQLLFLSVFVIAGVFIMFGKLLLLMWISVAMMLILIPFLFIGMIYEGYRILGDDYE
jgi:hypothetical protein